jgi:hypothetical protein
VLPIALSVSVVHPPLPDFKSSNNVWGATLVAEKEVTGIWGKVWGDLSILRGLSCKVNVLQLLQISIETAIEVVIEVQNFAGHSKWAWW